MANFRPKLKDLKQSSVYEAIHRNKKEDRVIRAERTIRAIESGRGYGKRR